MYPSVMSATRWVGPVRLDIEHQGGSRYAVVVTPSAGGRFRHEAHATHPPDESGIDRVAADVLTGLWLGTIPAPETFGAEQVYLDLLELVESRVADGQRWPVRRTPHAGAALVAVAADPMLLAGDDLPMRVEVADRAVSFDLDPEDESAQSAADHALEALAREGAYVRLASPYAGSISALEPDLALARLAELLGQGRYSGQAALGAEIFEFRDGECRVAGWETLTRQLHLAFWPDTSASAERLVGILAELAQRSDVADLDAQSRDEGFVVLASVQEPTSFLEATRLSLLVGGFRGIADLTAAGRWRFTEDGTTRLDQGVPL